MKTWMYLLAFLWTSPCLMAQSADYPWLEAYDPAQALTYRIAPPAGYGRDSLPAGSFGHWLRQLPLKPGQPPVHLYDGRLKGNQTAQVAVLDIDTGPRDLQQCADAVMRLRAEYLRACGAFEAIHFNFTSGHRADYLAWQAGQRPRISGNQVSWQASTRPDASYANFRRYLDCVFTYAGTHSLARELQPVPVAEIQPGDVFIQGGFPGHAVLVADVARHPQTGDKVFLLLQSYMPAQDMHLLHNPSDPDLSPWYALPEGKLRTPEWTFGPGDLKRFGE
jgi:hypothetical protein